MTPCVRAILIATPAIAANALAQTSESAYELSPLSVAARRDIPAFDSASQTMVEHIDPANRLAIAHDLSESLESYAAYSSFRRASSRAAHPTTQGVRLRNIGANATSRALVLLDGVPQNDSFGAWVYWHRYHMDSLADVSINPSGGGEAWGNFGSGGVISLISDAPSSNVLRSEVTYGSQETRSASLAATQSLGGSAFIDLSARLYRTEGFDTLPTAQSGPIDQPAGSKAETARARLRWTSAGDWQYSLSFDTFSEERNNGTPLTENDTDSLDLAFQATRRIDSESYLSLTAYSQESDFANVFSSVSDARDSETPALDQFSVPSDAAGLAVNYFKGRENGAYLLLGADYREADGEVNERFRNLGNGFTRERLAGGKQSFAGAFLTVSLPLSERDRVVASARFDQIENDNGIRREIDLANGNALVDTAFADTRGDKTSASLAWYREISDASQFRLKAATGFRSPTLNELYRPFRVKNDITEANAALRPETIRSIEAAWSYRPSDRYTLALTAYRYEIEDLVDNVTLSTDPGFHPLCGFVPEGGSCSHRLNLDETTVLGVEARISVEIAKNWKADFSYLFSDTEVTEFAAHPILEHNELPHSPEHKAAASLVYTPNETLTAWISLAASSDEFESIGSPEIIKSYASVNFGARYQIDSAQSLKLSIENLFDERIVSGISSSGLTSLGAPRGAWLSWSYRR